MSIAQNEAEKLYPPSTIGNGPYDRKSRIKAYVRGLFLKQHGRR